jgi:DNA-binding response OmpR family regulator
MGNSILAIDSDKRLLAVIENYLTLEGHRVRTANDVDQALATAAQHPPELILLEVWIPSETDARRFIERYRSTSPLPIILPMARLAASVRAFSMECGLADYIVKPFRPRDLTAHISAAFRRAGQPDRSPRLISAAGITLDKRSRSVMVGTHYVDLTPSEFDLLAVLMSSPGRVVSRQDLLDVVQGVRPGSNARLIDIHIKNLRSKIELDPHCPRYIQTVYGFGYRFSRQPPEPALSIPQA